MAVKYTLPFKAHDGVAWRVDIASDVYSVMPGASLTYSLSKQTLPYLIDGVEKIIINSILSDTLNTTGSRTATMRAADTYTFQGITAITPVTRPCFLRLTVTKDSIIIYQKFIDVGDTGDGGGGILSKSGIAQPGSMYTCLVETAEIFTSDTIDIPDNAPVAASNPITIRGVSEQALIIPHDVSTTDDPFSVLVHSKITINCYNEGNIDTDEMQTANAKDFTVQVYRKDVLKWSGFLDVANIQAPMLSVPVDLTLSATDGLDLLDFPYVHADLPGTTGTVSRCPMNYFRQILFVNLGITLPIRWTNDLTCTAFAGQDVFTGGVQWAANGEGFNSYQTNSTGDAVTTETCEYILTGLLQCMQCRIYQENGMWIIRRIPEYIRGSINYKQITGDLGIMTVQEATQNITKHIGRSGGYRFIQEDAVKTVKPGLKSCKVTYNFNKRDNILPNGSQDVRDAGGINPLYWGSYDPINLLAISAPPLDLRTGSSTTVTNTSGSTVNYFTLLYPGSTFTNDGIPVDTKTMVKKISFGFVFLALAGFPETGGIIDWSSNPFNVKVIFNAGSTKYYLTPYGFWSTTDTQISIIVDGLEIGEVAKVDFDKFQGILMPEPDVQPVAGDTSDIQVVFVVAPGQQYGLDYIYITVDSGNDVYLSAQVGSKNVDTDTRELTISSAFGGYPISNLMTNWSNSDSECFYTDASVYEGTLTGLTANAIMRYRYKASRIFNGTIYTARGDWSFDEIYTIDSLGATKFLPLNASYNVEKCECTIVAMEARNDFTIFTETYYNSNDTTLSN